MFDSLEIWICTAKQPANGSRGIAHPAHSLDCLISTPDNPLLQSHFRNKHLSPNIAGLLSKPIEVLTHQVRRKGNQGIRV